MAFLGGASGPPGTPPPGGLRPPGPPCGFRGGSAPRTPPRRIPPRDPSQGIPPKGSPPGDPPQGIPPRGSPQGIPPGIPPGDPPRGPPGGPRGPPGGSPRFRPLLSAVTPRLFFPTKRTNQNPPCPLGEQYWAPVGFEVRRKERQEVWREKKGDVRCSQAPWRATTAPQPAHLELNPMVLGRHPLASL